MILSVHLAPLRPRLALRALRTPVEAPGLRWGETLAVVPLAAPLFPPPRPLGAALVAAWEDDGALDAFLAHAPLAEQLSGGWHVRLEPLRAFGAWSPLPGLAEPPRPVDDDEPVAVLTYGTLKLHRAVPFLRASRPAERAAHEDPATSLGVGMARPLQRRVATFSVWRTAKEMKAYAHPPGPHRRASAAHKARAFHHESVFVRFRPYAARGSWQGRDPLEQAQAISSSRSTMSPA